MTADTLFSLANNLVLPAWLLLIVAPGWSWTQRLVHAAWIPLLLGGAYAALALLGPPAPEGAGFSSLTGVMRLFDAPVWALAGWIHYLVFDLFVGAWESRDARRRGVPHVWVVPCLLLTFLLGPAGLLVYLTVRVIKTGETTLFEVAEAQAVVPGPH